MSAALVVGEFVTPQERLMQLLRPTVISTCAYFGIEAALRSFIDQAKSRGDRGCFVDLRSCSQAHCTRTAELRSLLNSLLLGSVGAYGLMQFGPFSAYPHDVPDAPSSSSSEERLVRGVSQQELCACVFVGYMLHDALDMLWRRATNRADYAHHLIAGAATVIGLLYNLSPSAVLCGSDLFLLESSTVFLNVAHLSADLMAKGRTRRVVRTAALLTFLISFVGLRVVYLPMMLLSDRAQVMRLQMGRFFVLWYGLWGMQLYWLVQIVRMVRRNIANSSST